MNQALEARHGSTRGWWLEIVGTLGYRLGALRPFVELSPRQVHRLVFICLGNLNRSAFAAADARRLGLPKASILSFGIAAPEGATPPPLAVDVAAEFGVDLSAHRASTLGDYEFEPGDLLVAMEVRHARYLVHQGFTPGDIALLGHWAQPRRIHLQDPQGRSRAYYQTCFERVRSATRQLTDELRDGSSPACAPP